MGNYNPDFKGFLDVKTLRRGLKCSNDWLDRSAGADKTDLHQIYSLCVYLVSPFTQSSSVGVL